MRYPNYDGLESRPSIAPAYLDAIATVERSINTQSKPNGLAEKASRLIAKTCIDIQDQPKHANSWPPFADAAQMLDLTKKHQKSTTVHRSFMQHVMRLAFSTDALVDQVRQEMHADAIKNLKLTAEHLHGDPEHLDTHVGSLAELATLGVVTRLKHPGFMALPALPHHDSGQASHSNFDMLAVELDTNGDPLIHKAQIKYGCLGFCSHTSPLKQPRLFQSIRKRRAHAALYDPEIVMVSAHCDLNIEAGKAGVVDALIREYEGEITDDETGELDYYSSSMLLTLTSSNRL